ncbi:hypothetical protein Tco_1055069 [Tanacetum coccineum]|uniref:Uncharacterized protein n=1 Tax=Tanacetum coccineum TaxID=301880 RepID=A0ABQ5H0F7_9ASTR
MDLLAFIHVADPTKVRIVERESVEGEVKLLDSTMGSVVPLLPVAPDCADNELEAKIELVTTAKDTAIVAVERPKRQCKKRPAVADAGGSSHPPKKLRGDHGTSGGIATGGKSPSVIKDLLVRSILNVEAGVETVATLPFVTSSVSATPKHEGVNPTDSVTGGNLRTVGPAEKFVISPDSSHHSSTHASGAKVTSVIRSAALPPVITKAVITFTTYGIPSAPVPKTSAKVNTLVHASIFHDSDSVGMVRPDVAGPSNLPGKELSLRSQEVDSENLHEVFIPRWNVSNDAILDDFDTSREFIDHLAPPVILSEREDAEIENLKAQLRLKESEAAEAIQLRTQVSAAMVTEKIHVVEIETLKQGNVALENEKKSLDGKVTGLQSLVSTKDLELKDLNAALSSLQSQNDGLVDQVRALEATCSGLRG